MIAAFVLVLAGAAAVPLPPDPGYATGSARPGTQLTVSYTADAGFAGAVKLSCDPPGGGHPTAAEACATLAAADGDPARIPPGTNACVLVYAPVQAEVSGVWQGRTVAWQQRYGNACEMRRATGALFVF